jgi:hypothetical protein
VDPRPDAVPRLDGVAVGQLWRNRHATTGYGLNRIVRILLGGEGTYRHITDDYVRMEPVVQFEGEQERYEQHAGMGGTPLWSLAEHYELIDETTGEPAAEQPIPVVPLQADVERGYHDPRLFADAYRDRHDEGGTACRVSDRPPGWTGHAGVQSSLF